MLNHWKGLYAVLCHSQSTHLEHGCWQQVAEMQCLPNIILLRVGHFNEVVISPFTHEHVTAQRISGVKQKRSAREQIECLEVDRGLEVAGPVSRSKALAYCTSSHALSVHQASRVHFGQGTESARIIASGSKKFVSTLYIRGNAGRLLTPSPPLYPIGRIYAAITLGLNQMAR